MLPGSENAEALNQLTGELIWLLPLPLPLPLTLTLTLPLTLPLPLTEPGELPPNPNLDPTLPQAS